MMSGNGLATREQATAVAPPMVTPDQMALITKTVAQGATPDELKLYLYDCARQGVHPLDRMLHFTKRGNKYTPVTSIDLMRTRAADTGEYAGNDDPIFAEAADVTIRYPEAATVAVYRLVAGVRCPFTATARWDEYYPGDGPGGTMWRKMPHTMLGKCAEALALRKGFPKQLAGLYAREEMDQAQDPAPIVRAPQAAGDTEPNPADSVGVEAVPVRPPAPEGTLYIESCTPLNGKGKKAGTVTFSTGEEATVWQSTGQLFDLAVQLCQEGKPVRAELQAGKGNYGPTLKGLARADEHDQRRDTPGDWTQDVPPPDQPF